ncbi:MAG: hypothetical protein ACTJLK_03385, partial [Anaplasma sp.]
LLGPVTGSLAAAAFRAAWLACSDPSTISSAAKVGANKAALDEVVSARVGVFVDDAMTAMSTYQIKAVDALDAILSVSFEFVNATNPIAASGAFDGDVRSDSTALKIAVAQAKDKALAALDAAILATRKIAITCAVLEVADISDPSLALDNAVKGSATACDKAEAFLSAVERIESLVYSDADFDEIKSAVTDASSKAHAAVAASKSAFRTSAASATAVTSSVAPSSWKCYSLFFPGIAKMFATLLGSVLNVPFVIDRLFKFILGDVPRNVIAQSGIFLPWLLFGGPRDLDLTSELLRESPWVFSDAKAVLAKAQKLPDRLVELLQQLPAMLNTPATLAGALPPLLKKISYLFQDLPQLMIGDLRITLSYTASETTTGSVNLANLMVIVEEDKCRPVSFRVANDYGLDASLFSQDSNAPLLHVWRSRDHEHSPCSLFDDTTSLFSNPGLAPWLPPTSYRRQNPGVPQTCVRRGTRQIPKLQPIPQAQLRKAALLWNYSKTSEQTKTLYYPRPHASTAPAVACSSVLYLPSSVARIQQPLVDYILQQLVRPLKQRPYLLDFLKRHMSAKGSYDFEVLPTSPSLSVAVKPSSGSLSGELRDLELLEEHVLLARKSGSDFNCAVVRCVLTYRLVCEGIWVRLIPASIAVSVLPDESPSSAPLSSVTTTEGLFPFVLPRPYRCLYADIRANKAVISNGSDQLVKLVTESFRGAVRGYGPSNQVNRIGRALLGLGDETDLDLLGYVSLPVWTGDRLRVDKHSLFRNRASGVVHHLHLSYYLSPREKTARVEHIIVAVRSEDRPHYVVPQSCLHLVEQDGKWSFVRGDSDSPTYQDRDVSLNGYHVLTSSGNAFGEYQAFRIPDVVLPSTSAYLTLVEDGLLFVTTELFPIVPHFEPTELVLVEENELLKRLENLFAQAWVFHVASAQGGVSPSLTIRTTFQRVTPTPGVEEVFCLFDVGDNERVKLHAVATLQHKTIEEMPFYDIVQLRSRVVDSSFDFQASVYSKPSPSSDRVPFITCFDASSQSQIVEEFVDDLEEQHLASAEPTDAILEGDVPRSGATGPQLASTKQIREFVLQACRNYINSEEPGTVLYDDKIVDELVEKYRGKLTVEQVVPHVHSV